MRDGSKWNTSNNWNVIDLKGFEWNVISGYLWTFTFGSLGDSDCTPLIWRLLFLTRLLDLVLRLARARSLLRFVWLYAIFSRDCRKAKHAKPIEPLHANYHIETHRDTQRHRDTQTHKAITHTHTVTDTDTQTPRFQMRNLHADYLWQSVTHGACLSKSQAEPSACQSCWRAGQGDTPWQSVTHRLNPLEIQKVCLILLDSGCSAHAIPDYPRRFRTEWVAHSWFSRQIMGLKRMPTDLVHTHWWARFENFCVKGETIYEASKCFWCSWRMLKGAQGNCRSYWWGHLYLFEDVEFSGLLGCCQHL